MNENEISKISLYLMFLSLTISDIVRSFEKFRIDIELTTKQIFNVFHFLLQ